jgi:hypothetical protein
MASITKQVSNSFKSLLFFKALEYRRKKIANHVEDFVVVVFDGHFKIETNKLCQMPVGV